MEYTLDERGQWVVNLYKRQLPYEAPDNRPKSEVIPLHRLRGGLRGGLYGGRDLTICGLSGGRLNSAPSGDGMAWRSEE